MAVILLLAKLGGDLAVIDDVLGLIVLAVVSGIIVAADHGGSLSSWRIGLTLGRATAVLAGSLVIGFALSLHGARIIDQGTYSAVVVMVIVTTMVTPPSQVEPGAKAGLGKGVADPDLQHGNLPLLLDTLDQVP